MRTPGGTAFGVEHCLRGKQFFIATYNELTKKGKKTAGERESREILSKEGLQETVGLGVKEKKRKCWGCYEKKGRTELGRQLSPL